MPTVKSKTFVLEFDDPDYADIEIRCQSVSLARYFEIVRIIEDDPEAGMREFAKNSLVSWNLEDPADPKGLAAQPFEFTQAVLRGWVQAMTTVSRPLGGGSNSGASFPEASIPMVTL